jgi:hypothetical protein
LNEVDQLVNIAGQIGGMTLVKAESCKVRFARMKIGKPCGSGQYLLALHVRKFVGGACVMLQGLTQGRRFL